MCTQKEIEQELTKIMTEWGDVTTAKPVQYDRAALAAQALAWVLGDELTASEHLKDIENDA